MQRLQKVQAQGELSPSSALELSVLESENHRMQAYDSQIKDLEDQCERSKEITRRLLEGISNQL